MNIAKHRSLIFKVIFSLGIAGPTFGKLSQNQQLINTFTGLGYPQYTTYILGVAYLCGIVSLFQGRLATLREWAYAGFTFALIGALSSHLLAGDKISNIVPAIMLLSFLSCAYFFEKRDTGSISTETLAS